MSETSSRVRLMANLQAAVAEAVSGTEEWAQTSALAKIAVISESND